MTLSEEKGFLRMLREVKLVPADDRRTEERSAEEAEFLEEYAKEGAGDLLSAQSFLRIIALYRLKHSDDIARRCAEKETWQQCEEFGSYTVVEAFLLLRTAVEATYGISHGVTIVANISPEGIISRDRIAEISYEYDFPTLKDLLERVPYKERKVLPFMVFLFLMFQEGIRTDIGVNVDNRQMTLAPWLIPRLEASVRDARQR